MAERRVDPGEQRSAETVLRAILRGAELDSVTFRSTVLTLGFVDLAAEGREDRPVYVWLSTIANAEAIEDGAEADLDPSIEALPESRARFLPEAYRLLGKEVGEIAIASGGSLMLTLPGAAMLIHRESSDLDEVWSVTSDTPEVMGDSRWRVTLFDNGRLVVKRPD
jgi:hypothetical protein